MIRKAITWLRVVLPPGWAVVLALACWLSCESLYFWIESWVPGAGTAAGILKGRDAVVCAMAACYAVYRVIAFHPLFNESYYLWLTLTPWRRGTPLPVGPVHLVAQDALVLGLMLTLMHNPQIWRLTPVSLFFLSYLGTLAVSFLLVGMWGFGYGLAFGLGLVVYLDVREPAGLIACLPLTVLGQLGLRAQWDRFPWQVLPLWDKLRKQFIPSKRTVDGLGWPFDQFQPQPSTVGISYRDGVLLSLLAGWWVFALAANETTPNSNRGVAYALYWYLLLAIVFSRLFRYCRHHRPPISLWGRLWTLRWIIPGYDLVFLAPFATILVGVGAPAALELLVRSTGFSLPVVPISSSLVLLLAINLGPTFETWRLTGNHRIVPSLNKQEFQQL
ncbi:MAG TPA: hypothetical protein VND64_14680 [Pirellulales bacterium]|nr:hypothetical protein [Pirellulales bacterium]